MADFGADLRSYLILQSEVTDEVGTRIRRNAASQNETRPFVVYTILNTDTHQGLDSNETGARVSDVEIIVEAETAGDAKNAADAIRTTLKAAANTTMGSPGTVVEYIHFEGEQQSYDPPDDGSQNGLHLVTQDYRIFHGV